MISTQFPSPVSPGFRSASNPGNGNPASFVVHQPWLAEKKTAFEDHTSLDGDPPFLATEIIIIKFYPRKRTHGTAIVLVSHRSLAFVSVRGVFFNLALGSCDGPRACGRPLNNRRARSAMSPAQRFHPVHGVVVLRAVVEIFPPSAVRPPLGAESSRACPRMSEEERLISCSGSRPLEGPEGRHCLCGGSFPGATPDLPTK